MTSTFETTISLVVGGIAHDIAARVRGTYTAARRPLVYGRHDSGAAAKFRVESIALRAGEAWVELPTLTMLVTPEQYEQLKDHGVEYCETEGAIENQLTKQW